MLLWVICAANFSSVPVTKIPLDTATSPACVTCSPSCLLARLHLQLVLYLGFCAFHQLKQEHERCSHTFILCFFQEVFESSPRQLLRGHRGQQAQSSWLPSPVSQPDQRFILFRPCLLQGTPSTLSTKFRFSPAIQTRLPKGAGEVCYTTWGIKTQPWSPLSMLTPSKLLVLIALKRDLTSFGSHSVSVSPHFHSSVPTLRGG